MVINKAGETSLGTLTGQTLDPNNPCLSAYIKYVRTILAQDPRPVPQQWYIKWYKERNSRVCGSGIGSGFHHPGVPEIHLRVSLGYVDVLPPLSGTSLLKRGSVGFAVSVAVGYTAVSTDSARTRIYINTEMLFYFGLIFEISFGHNFWSRTRYELKFGGARGPVSISRSTKFELATRP